MSGRETPRALPRHLAVIMDGNGRWAQARRLPRAAGHREGAAAARILVETCARRGIEVLTLFAFSSENWQRPGAEVRALLDLFATMLRQEQRRLMDNGVRLRVIGDRAAFAGRLRARMEAVERATASGGRMTLAVAMGYGGRWDIVQAARTLARRAAAGELAPDALDERALAAALSLGDLPDADLLIRTGGEQRVSNFLLWQLAYAELYFCDALWPDFDTAHLERALDWYATRQRRFGRVAGDGAPEAVPHPAPAGYGTLA
jgi:undecaprenyl diphosphate synthase